MVLQLAFERYTFIRDAERLAKKAAQNFADKYRLKMEITGLVVNGSDTMNPDFDENAKPRSCVLYAEFYKCIRPRHMS